MGGKKKESEEGRQEGKSWEVNKQVLYRGTEIISESLNFIATLEARRKFTILKENYLASISIKWDGVMKTFSDT